MTNETTAEVILLLDDSFTVPQKSYNQVREQVTDIAPALTLDKKYTLQMLCGPEYWDSLTMHERRLAGKCMVHMVENQLVPYDFGGRYCQHPKVYNVIS